jgi:serine/threonine-protein kinase
MPEPADESTPSHATGSFPEARVTLSVPALDGAAANPVAAPGPLPAQRQTLGGRYEIDTQIACGGVGVIFRGRDILLGRELAVKALRAEHADNPDMLRRFVEEAQIAGQLQHPGVVSVYEVGRFADGTPFIAMKLVKGRTLAALLRERSDPGHNRAKLLHVFEQVCQTVAYAHARGVIHRDLKPSNVMVGGFGEVQVMDWGLAKVLAEKAVSTHADAGPGTVIRTDGGDGSATREGTVAGTPAYMSPEQALGELDRIDERADVFGLGAIMCEILTGQPPYPGLSGNSVLRHARRVDLAEALARLDGCAADSELVELTRQCLAPDPHDRPRDARAVAEAVTGYLTGVEERLRTAEIERAKAETAGAGERRARRLTGGLAAAVLILAAGGMTAGWWLTHLRTDAERQVGVALAEAQVQGAQGNWAGALAAVRRAESLAASPSAPADLRRHVTAAAAEFQSQAAAAERDRRMLDRLVEIRAHRAGGTHSAHAFPRQYRVGVVAEYAVAFREYGIDVVAMSPGETAEAIRARPAVAAQLTAALDDWALECAERYRSLEPLFPADQHDWQNLVEAARLADPDPRRNLLRRALGQQPFAIDTAPFAEMASPESIAALPPITVQLLAAAFRRAGDEDAALAALRKAQRVHPSDLWLNYDLARSFETQGDDDQAARFYTAARTIRPEVGHALAHVLERQGRGEAAVDLFRELTRLRPDSPSHYVCLAHALFEEREFDAALVACRRALELKANKADPSLIRAATLAGRGDLGAAETEFRALLEAYPSNCAAYDELGQLLARQGRVADAVPAFEQALLLARELRPGNRATADQLRSIIDGIQNRREDTERLLRLDARLPALLRGDDRPKDADERLAVARLLDAGGQADRAARWYADAFAAAPALAGDPPTPHRHAAARAAALAGTGRFLDAARLDAAARARWRRQALDWLLLDVAYWNRRLADGKPADRTAARRFLRDMRLDGALIGVRDDAAAELPEDERGEWHGLWVEIDALLSAACGKD